VRVINFRIIVIIIISCFIKIQIVLLFLVPAYPGCPGKMAVKWLSCVAHLLFLTVVPKPVSLNHLRSPAKQVEKGDQWEPARPGLPGKQ